MKYIVALWILSSTLVGCNFDELRWYLYGEHYLAKTEMYEYEANHHFPPAYWLLKGKSDAYEKVIEKIIKQ